MIEVQRGIWRSFSVELELSGRGRGGYYRVFDTFDEPTRGGRCCSFTPGREKPRADHEPPGNWRRRGWCRGERLVAGANPHTCRCRPKDCGDKRASRVTGQRPANGQGRNRRLSGSATSEFLTSRPYRRPVPSTSRLTLARMPNLAPASVQRPARASSCERRSSRSGRASENQPRNSAPWDWRSRARSRKPPDTWRKIPSA